MFYALIMAGGSGTRLWPLSREARPKQSLALVGERTMFQHAVERLAPDFSPEQIFVVTNKEYAPLLQAQTPDIPMDNFIIEPEGRGTAPAIGLGALVLQRKDPGAVMAVLTADHFIGDTAGFRAALSAAHKGAQQGHLVTLGIRANHPSTGYGYIQQGEELGTLNRFPAYRVEKFTEKPSAETAVAMLASGDYSWNSGMFIWKVERIMEEFARQMPEFRAQLKILEAAAGGDAFNEALGKTWPQVKKQTIDYGIMEGAQDVIVLPVDIQWTDVGSWASLYDILPADAEGNIRRGDQINLDTRGSLIFGDKRLIATIGVEDMVIVDTEDALLICPRTREQEVKDIVNRLKADRRTAWL